MNLNVFKAVLFSLAVMLNQRYYVIPSNKNQFVSMVKELAKRLFLGKNYRAFKAFEPES